jgi:hypothetical protein
MRPEGNAGGTSAAYGLGSPKRWATRNGMAKSMTGSGTSP